MAGHHFSLNISIPLGGQTAPGFTLFSTIELDYPFDTITEKGSSILLNWFFSLYPDSFTCLKITQTVLRVHLDQNAIGACFLHSDSHKSIAHLLEQIGKHDFFILSFNV